MHGGEAQPHVPANLKQLENLLMELKAQWIGLAGPVEVALLVMPAAQVSAVEMDLAAMGLEVKQAMMGVVELLVEG